MTEMLFEHLVLLQAHFDLLSFVQLPVVVQTLATKSNGNGQNRQNGILNGSDFGPELFTTNAAKTT